MGTESIAKGRRTQAPKTPTPDGPLTPSQMERASENCKSYVMQCALMLAAGKPIRRNGELLTMSALDKVACEFEESNLLISDIKAMQSAASYNRMMRSVQEHRATRSGLPASSVPHPDSKTDCKITPADIINALHNASQPERNAIRNLLS